MTGSRNRRVGAQAEREAAAQLSDLLGVKCVRRRNLGTHDDIGDLIVDIPAYTSPLPGGWKRQHPGIKVCIQVTARADLDRAVREKLPELKQQMARMGTEYGALVCRRYGGKFLWVQELEDGAKLLREAIG